MGILNSVLTLLFGMTSWIVTMATQYICIGFATVICRGAAISGLGDAVKAMNAARPLGLSWMFFIMLGILVITEVLIRFTPIGRAIHSVGLNPMAARIAGINVKLTKALCMIFCSIMGGVCGILQVINTVAANDALGKGNEFPAIICCVSGGRQGLHAGRFRRCADVSDHEKLPADAGIQQQYADGTYRRDPYFGGCH